jgi:PAS domain S-box-containing protein
MVLGVLASAGYAGLVAGLLATVIAVAVVASGFDWSRAADASTQIARLGLFALGCVVAAFLADALYRARRRAEAAYRAIARESVKKRDAEERLASSKARLRLLIDSFPDIVFVADARGSSAYENPRWSEFSGANPRDTGQVHWAEHVHPADRNRVLGAWSVSVNSGVPFEARCRLGDSSGLYRWFLVRARAVTTGADQPAHWFGVATDIDAQMRAEATLRDRDEQLRLSLASTGLGVVELEFWTRRVVWSERCRAICRFVRDEPLTPRRIRAVVHPDDRRRTVRAFTPALDPRGNGEFALEHRHAAARRS